MMFFMHKSHFMYGINRVKDSLQGTFHSLPGIFNSLNIKVSIFFLPFVNVT